MDDFGRAHGLKSARLRYFNAAGAEPTAEIGEDHDPETHLIPLVLDAASGRRSAVTVFGTDYPTADGTAIRDYVHVSDLARAHVLALQHLLEPRRHHRGQSRQRSRRLGPAGDRHGSKRHRPRIPVRDAPRRPGILRFWWPMQQGREILGWAPERSDLATIIADAWRWHSRRFGAHRRRMSLHWGRVLNRRT